MAAVAPIRPRLKCTLIGGTRSKYSNSLLVGLGPQTEYPDTADKAVLYFNIYKIESTSTWLYGHILSLALFLGHILCSCVGSKKDHLL